MAGLPNITGHDALSWYGLNNGLVNNNSDRSGCFPQPTLTAYGGLGGNNAGVASSATVGVQFNASLSNNIYGNSQTVTPLSEQCLFYIKY